jgi:hypothetical protein
MILAGRLILVFLILLCGERACASAASVSVVDAVNGQPIPGAWVTAEGLTAATDDQGRFILPAPAARVAVRAPGYRRARLEDPSPLARDEVVLLQPFHPKALYLSIYGIGDRALRTAALDLINRTELNALVINVKGDGGQIPYPSAMHLAAAVGAQKLITVHDMPDLLATLHQRGIYLVARVVAYKDDPLARARPHWGVHRRDGTLYSDPEGQAWTDPFRPEVREYVLGVAEEVARMGFDEIQFDYLRFPDDQGLVFAQPSTEEDRVAAISKFLAEARQRLAPYNVFVSADVFGYVLWNRNDTAIGQRLEDLVPYLDYVSPMLYPSGFKFGIPGYRNPVEKPFETIEQSLANARKRTGLPAVRFRPWLQAFRDYAFDQRPFGAAEIRAQIDAAEAFGSDGWMLWNPRNVYSEAGLKEGKRP